MAKTRQGQAPYGFRWQGGRLHLEPEEASIRKLAFDLFLRIGTMGGVARELNRRGKTTRKGGAWSDMQVGRILQCPSAIGRYEIGEGGVANGGRSEIVECEPIVTKAVWDAVSRLIASRRVTEPAPAAPTLSGLIWCSCGERMRWHGEAAEFSCAICRHTISEKEITAIFAADFQETLTAHPVLAVAICGPAAARPAAIALQKLQSEVHGCEQELIGVERMYREKAVDKRRFDELQRPLTRKLADLANRETSLRTELRHHDPPTPKDWRTEWRSWASARQITFIASLVARFTIGLDEANISYLLPDPSVSKEAATPQQITHPTNQAGSGGPVYIRLPKPGQQCPITGLSRAKLNELILPNQRNNFRPPVASKSLRTLGQQKGVRLILLESLLAYLSGNP
jgi:hypothetical protein